MKRLLFPLLFLSTMTMTNVFAQQMTCDDIVEIIQLEERSWNEKKDLLNPGLFTEDYRYYTGDVLTYEKFAGRSAAIQRTHNEIDNLKFEVLDHGCSDQRVTLFWKTTGIHQQFKIPVTVFGMTLNKIKNGQVYESIAVHDLLPSLQKAGFKISPGEASKE